MKCFQLLFVDCSHSHVTRCGMRNDKSDKKKRRNEQRREEKQKKNLWQHRKSPYVMRATYFFFTYSNHQIYLLTNKPQKKLSIDWHWSVRNWLDVNPSDLCEMQTVNTVHAQFLSENHFLFFRCLVELLCDCRRNNPTIWWS